MNFGEKNVLVELIKLTEKNCYLVISFPKRKKVIIIDYLSNVHDPNLLKSSYSI